MDIRKVQQLLDKYYEGTTSLEEEKFLHDYFSRDDIPSELMAERDMFIGLDQMGNTELTNMDDMLTEMIDESSAKGKQINLIRWATSIAASVVLIVGLGIVLLNQNNTSSDLATWEDTYSDPEQSYEAAQFVLQFVSSKYKEGVGELSKIPDLGTPQKSFNKALSTYQKGLDQLKILENINQ
ncbi:hypothetical protein EYV94_00465 [Puteibacter caeruleilacunae]|nr:hypothetical protein EYV94_00465 [Puteibacter caeruleilacunae]